MANAKTIYNVVNACIANEEIKDVDFDNIETLNGKIKKHIQVMPKPKSKQGEFSISKTGDNIVIMIDKEKIYPTDDVSVID